MSGVPDMPGPCLRSFFPAPYSAVQEDREAYGPGWPASLVFPVIPGWGVPVAGNILETRIS